MIQKFKTTRPLRLMKIDQCELSFPRHESMPHVARIHVLQAPVKQTLTYVDKWFSTKAPKQLNEERQVFSTSHAETMGKTQAKHEP